MRTPRIESNPVREPINKQSALIMRPASWINRPLINETVPIEKYEAVKKENEALKLSKAAQAQHIQALKKKVSKLAEQLLESDKELRAVLAEGRARADALDGDEKVMAHKFITKSETLLKVRMAVEKL